MCWEHHLCVFSVPWNWSQIGMSLSLGSQVPKQDSWAINTSLTADVSQWLVVGRWGKFKLSLHIPWNPLRKGFLGKMPQNRLNHQYQYGRVPCPMLVHDGKDTCGMPACSLDNINRNVAGAPRRGGGWQGQLKLTNAKKKTRQVYKRDIYRMFELPYCNINMLPLMALDGGKMWKG